MPKGSPRPTAGRKPLYAGGMSKAEVFLTPELRAAAAALGDGNVSAGIRTALAMVAPQPPAPREVQVWRDPAYYPPFDVNEDDDDIEEVDPFAQWPEGTF